MIDKRMYRETFSQLRASDQAKQEVLQKMQEMKQRKRMPRVLRGAALAAAMVMALAVTAGAVNECKKLLRSPWRRRTGPLEEAGEPAFDTPEQSELFRQVMALPPKYRAAVYLYYYEGCSVQETAAAMGANPSTVQTWLMRARGKLKLILQEAET